MTLLLVVTIILREKPCLFCRFQSEDSVDSTTSGGSVDSTGNSSTGRTSGTGSISVELSRTKPLPQVGYESVSSRKTAFEIHSDENLCKYLSHDFKNKQWPKNIKEPRTCSSNLLAQHSKIWETLYDISVCNISLNFSAAVSLFYTITFRKPYIFINLPM